MGIFEKIYLICLGLVFVGMLCALIVGPWDIRKLGAYFKEETKK